MAVIGVIRVTGIIDEIVIRNESAHALSNDRFHICVISTYDTYDSYDSHRRIWGFRVTGSLGSRMTPKTTGARLLVAPLQNAHFAQNFGKS
jgi:hypothetical protein